MTNGPARQRRLPICPASPGYCLVSICRHHARFAASGCAVDIAEAGPHTQREISELLGMDESRVGQIERTALAKLRAAVGDLK